MDGFELLGADDPSKKEEPSWWSTHWMWVVGGVTLAGIVGMIAHDMLAYNPAKPRGWVQGVGWKSEAARIKANAKYARWRDLQNLKLVEERIKRREKLNAAAVARLAARRG